MDFGDVVLAFGAIFIYTALIMTWFFAVFDLFARGDLSWPMKVFWLFAIILVPILGVLVYFLLRPRDAQWWGPRGGEVALSTRDWQISEVETLVRLRNQGTITDAEFERMKQRVIMESPATGSTI